MGSGQSAANDGAGSDGAASRDLILQAAFPALKDLFADDREQDARGHDGFVQARDGRSRDELARRGTPWMWGCQP